MGDKGERRRGDGRRSDMPPLPPTWARSEAFLPRAFVQPALRFMRMEAAGGIVMLLAALAALLWANSPWSGAYFDFWETRIELAFGGFHFEHLSELTLREWVNDALMVMFFFVVGLEIKRELVVGELREPRTAALPAIAALGGMVLPAGIYAAFNVGGPGAAGWGIPMATDIAFAVGIIALLGPRVPVTAKLFLLALAIVDDLGGILVIALFYTAELSAAWLGAAALGLLVIVAMGRAGVRSLTPYVAMGGLVWLATLESGVHATVAGVALALLTPTRSLLNPAHFEERGEELVRRIADYIPDDAHDAHDMDHPTLERVQALLQDLRRLATETIPPLDRLEVNLQPWSAFVVIPVFAFANAGVRLRPDLLEGATSDPVLIGVFLGLVVGKFIGVTGFAWMAQRLGLGRLPRGATWGHMVGVGLLSGVGFTVALFIGALSFPVGSPLADSAKVGIFAASLVSGVLGYVWLRLTPRRGASGGVRESMAEQPAAAG